MLNVATQHFPAVPFYDLFSALVLFVIQAIQMLQFKKKKQVLHFSLHQVYTPKFTVSHHLHNGTFSFFLFFKFKSS